MLRRVLDRHSLMCSRSSLSNACFSKDTWTEEFDFRVMGSNLMVSLHFLFLSIIVECVELGRVSVSFVVDPSFTFVSLYPLGVHRSSLWQLAFMVRVT